MTSAPHLAKVLSAGNQASLRGVLTVLFLAVVAID